MKSCDACGLTETQALADAKTLGLLEEFRGGVYTCCQVAMWGDEQWLAWLDAVDGGGTELAAGIELPEEPEESLLLPVRLRRPVPWFRG
jgi:hypothetical protein